MIRIKRVYEGVEAGDGKRVLVDRLWPRGVKKEAVSDWIREVGPSNALRKWFGHDAAKWVEFRRRYVAELEGKPEGWEALLQCARDGDITLLYGVRDTEHNNAVALKGFLEHKLGIKAESHHRKAA
jgi:uncharacterized protein YeaO (DUF488 family)